MIDLPDDPGPASATPELMDFGAMLTPPLGGPVQRVERLGGRWRISVTMPPLKTDVGRIWVARLVRGKTEGVRMALPLQGFDPGACGNPVVDGSGQSGGVLNLKTCTPTYRFREGQFLSVVTGGRHHLVMVASEVAVGADGKVALPIRPLIRVAHLDSDAVHVSRPMIEGYVPGDSLPFDVTLANFYELGFDIEEAA